MRPFSRQTDRGRWAVSPILRGGAGGKVSGIFTIVCARNADHFPFLNNSITPWYGGPGGDAVAACYKSFTLARHGLAVPVLKYRI